MTPFLKAIAIPASWLLTALILRLLAGTASSPGVLPDEMCHLGWSRLLSGTGSFFSMGIAGYCEPGYAILLTPLRWLFTDQDQFYQAVLAGNALLAATCLPLARHVGMRYFGMSKAQGWAIGCLVVCYPALMVYSRYALPETLLYVLTLVWLGALARWLERRDTPSLMALTLAGFAVYLTHSRMILFVLALLAGVIIHLATSKATSKRKTTLGLLVASGTVLLAMHTLKQSVLPLGWAADPLIAIDRVANTFRTEAMLSILSKFAGQSLFVLIATTGLASLPAAWIIGRTGSALRNGGLRKFDALDLKAGCVTGMLILMILEGAVFLNSADRFDLTFYGRYAGPLVTASMVVGFALLTDRRATRMARPLALIVITCLVFVGLKTPLLPYADYSRIHVVGALPLVDWLSYSDDGLTLWLRLALTSTVFAAISVFLLYKTWHWYAGTCLVTMLAMHAIDPFPRGPDLMSHIPVSVQHTLDASPCTILWSRSIAGRLENHQKFRLQYAFPQCTFAEIESFDCRTLSPSTVVIAPDSSGCRRNGAKTTRFPPSLIALESEVRAFDSIDDNDRPTERNDREKPD